MKNIIKGDIVQLALSGEFDIIVHGCNCFHTMNGGVAKAIKASFPEAYSTDKTFTDYGDKTKLGKISYVTVKRPGVSFYVVNAYTQYDFGNDGKRRVDYDAVRSCFEEIAKTFTTDNRIGYPAIGSGLAGGDWETISKIIDTKLEGYNHTLVLFG